MIQNQIQEADLNQSDDQKELFVDNNQINLNVQKESESSRDSPN